MQEVQMPKTEYALGRSKVFIRNPRSLLELEEKRRVRNLQLLIKIQSLYRSWKLRTRYKKMRKAATTIKSYFKGWKAKSLYQKQRKAAILIQSIVRMWKHRKVNMQICLCFLKLFRPLC